MKTYNKNSLLEEREREREREKEIWLSTRVLTLVLKNTFNFRS